VGVALVGRSEGGMDIEYGDQREIHAIGLEILALLREGPYERELTTRTGVRCKVRWHLEAE
jgi:hypothetical protein